MTIPHVAALDLGAADLKLQASYDPGKCVIIPDYLAVEPRIRLYEPPANPLHGLHLFVSQSPCGIRGEYAFGRLAMENRGTPLDPQVNKLDAQQIRYALITGLAVEAARTGATQFNIAVGVPMMDFPDRERRLAFGAQFKGDYALRFVQSTNPNWGSLGEIRFNVSRVLVVCEGAPAVTVMPEPERGRDWRAVADLGGSTLDLPVFERTVIDGRIVMELRSPYCGAAEIGLNGAMERLTREINRTYGRSYTRAEVSVILADRGGDMDNGLDSPISILPLAEQHLAPVADEVAGELLRTWKRQPAIAAFELIGGGSVVLYHLLVKAVEALWQRDFPTSPVPFALRPVPNARVLNALGFYAQAMERFGNG